MLAGIEAGTSMTKLKRAAIARIAVPIKSMYQRYRCRIVHKNRTLPWLAYFACASSELQTPASFFLCPGEPTRLVPAVAERKHRGL